VLPADDDLDVLVKRRQPVHQPFDGEALQLVATKRRNLRLRQSQQLRVHDLRHTFATLLLQAGAPITSVSQQIGHADASITLRVYAQYLPDPSRKDVDLLDTQPSAPPAQPDKAIGEFEGSGVAEMFGKEWWPAQSR